MYTRVLNEFSFEIHFTRDAGHTVHPLAGQGVNLGIADACTLATVLVDGLETGQDIGQLSLLQYYEEQRYDSQPVSYWMTSNSYIY